ncbi:DUF5324 family protein [Actinocrinis sp.]|uniref:DUF5324 family protein n=1 Tax=Actinocrinis sp. TaxID=1920516 RepID=UPI002CB6ECD3|nr:DUF5324 family protein [Actinocrinis sp.]HXR69526.1 DUF5324 family protein [Actinocrinis sp.]
MKTSHSKPLERGAVQPWFRDQYQTLRTEAGPRLEHARAAVVPVLADASHKVRDELVPKVRDELVPKVRDEFVPATVQFSSRVADEAMQRSAPLRAELSDRANAALAAARGQVTTAQIEQLNRGRRRGHRKLWLIGGAAAAGAALGTAAVLWQRSREQAWVEDDAVNAALSTNDAEIKQMDGVDRDDPSDPDGGIGGNADSSSSAPGRHSGKR